LARQCARYFTADLQDYAAFYGVWRASTRIEPTGKGFRPLPVIDLKRNLQKNRMSLAQRFSVSTSLALVAWGVLHRFNDECCRVTLILFNFLK
jgi:hypothetical protein